MVEPWTDNLETQVRFLTEPPVILENDMLMVKTYLAASKIHGVGCYAAEQIPKDTTIWIFDSGIDTLHTEEQLAKLSLACQEQIRKYAYWDVHYNAFVLCGDDSRFFNHSDTPSCLDKQPDGSANVTSAARDIQIGEELTSDYSTFTTTVDFPIELENRCNRIVSPIFTWKKIIDNGTRCEFEKDHDGFCGVK